MTNLVFSVEKTRQHEVAVVMISFWEALHKFIASKRPHLLTRPAS